MKVQEELGEFGVATEEALDRRQIRAGFRQRNADRGMGIHVLIPLSAFLCRIGSEPADDLVEDAVGVEEEVEFEVGGDGPGVGVIEDQARGNATGAETRR